MAASMASIRDTGSRMPHRLPSTDVRAGTGPLSAPTPPAVSAGRRISQRELARAQANQLPSADRRHLMERLQDLVNHMEGIAEQIAKGEVNSARRSVLIMRFNELRRQVNSIDGIVGSAGYGTRGSQAIAAAGLSPQPAITTESIPQSESTSTLQGHQNTGAHPTAAPSSAPRSNQSNPSEQVSDGAPRVAGYGHVSTSAPAHSTSSVTTSVSSSVTPRTNLAGRNAVSLTSAAQTGTYLDTSA